LRTLALLKGAETRTAQALIASLSYESRTALSAYKLIEPIIQRQDAVSVINITNAGWRIIEACSKVYPPTESQERAWAVELKTAGEAYRQGRLAAISRRRVWQMFIQKRANRSDLL